MAGTGPFEDLIGKLAGRVHILQQNMPGCAGIFYPHGTHIENPVAEGLSNNNILHVRQHQGARGARNNSGLDADAIPRENRQGGPDLNPLVKGNEKQERYGKGKPESMHLVEQQSAPRQKGERADGYGAGAHELHGGANFDFFHEGYVSVRAAS